MNALTFDDTTISIIDRDGLTWLPGPEIGLALGYESPGDAIRKVFERHRSEFSEETTTTTKLGGVGGAARITRVFSPRGALLLAMHANTPRAAAFRAWVLDILEGRVPLPGKADRLSRVTEALLLARPRWGRHLRYRGMGLTHAEIARLEQVSPSCVSLDANALRDLGLIAAPKGMVKNPLGGAAPKAVRHV